MRRPAPSAVVRGNGYVTAHLLRAQDHRTAAIAEAAYARLLRESAPPPGAARPERRSHPGRTILAVLLRCQRRGRRLARALVDALAALPAYPAFWRPGTRRWCGLPPRNDDVAR